MDDQPSPFFTMEDVIKQWPKNVSPIRMSIAQRLVQYRLGRRLGCFIQCGHPQLHAETKCVFCNEKRLDLLERSTEEDLDFLEDTLLEYWINGDIYATVIKTDGDDLLTKSEPDRFDEQNAKIDGYVDFLKGNTPTMG